MTALLELGDGACVAAGVAPKAAMLDHAGCNGLPVPPGFAVPDGTIPADAAAVICNRLTKPVAVRSAFGTEDRDDQSLAGHFDSILNVDPTTAEVALAIDAVLSSGSEEYRRDVLVMEMVTPTVAGVAFTERGWADDLINYTDGLGDELLSGETEGSRLQIARLQSLERPDAQIGEWQGRLALLLRRVRKVFGDKAWDVEWADDGSTCWLLQVRPVTASPVRDEVFSLANHKEILPDPPSVFMTSLIAEASPRLTGPMGIIDSSIAGRKFIEVFDERPYVNHSLITDFLRNVGLPSRLVADTLGGDFEQGSPIRPLRIVRNLPTFLRMGIAALTAPKSARDAGNRLEAYARNKPRDHSFGESLDGAGESYVSLVNEMANLATVMALPVALLNKVGTLEHHLANQETAGTRMLLDMIPMADLASRDPALQGPLAQGRVPDSPAFQELWTLWLERHGHRGHFESDLARPRYDEDPVGTLQSIAAMADQPTRYKSRTGHRGTKGLRTRASWPLWMAARGPMAAREELRARAMRAFAKCRADLLAAAEAAESRGLIADPDDIWFLTTAELRALDHDHAPQADLVEERRASITAARVDGAPDLRSRMRGALDDSSPPPESDDGSLQGIPLTTGVETGMAWVLDEPASTPPESNGEPLILVARSVDAGWVATFGLVTAVAVEIGGDLSHGSIILRELGLPAITNVRGVTSAISTGDIVRLDARSGQIAVRQAA